MTSDQVTEWNYRYDERIAILCGDKQPTTDQHRLALKEADEAVNKQTYESRNTERNQQA